MNNSRHIAPLSKKPLAAATVGIMALTPLVRLILTLQYYLSGCNGPNPKAMQT